MDESILVLGRQTALGLAEVESLYGSAKVKPIGHQAALVKVDPCILAFSRLGGSTKFCRPLTELDTVDWNKIDNFLLEVAPGHSLRMPEGKMQLGLSLVGLNVPLKRLEATGLKLKKAIRGTGRPVRLVPNKTAELNAAQIIHNKLTGPNGWELVFIKNGDKTVIAQTVKVQDIESYTSRDRGRPMRDARVGMLPPKLAQIIINLATGKLPENKLQNICDIPAGEPIPPNILEKTLLDPFCGTGVVLQEALLMGYSVYGTDLEPRMVDYTRQNLDWLKRTYNLQQMKSQIEPGDATTYSWQQGTIDFVASETYLGRPFTSYPEPEVLSRTVAECNLIIKKFLLNIHHQLEAGTRLCLAIPAWSDKNGGFKHLPLLDSLEELGYNRISFEHASSDKLLYFREDQIVARELLVLQAK